MNLRSSIRKISSGVIIRLWVGSENIEALFIPSDGIEKNGQVSGGLPIADRLSAKTLYLSSPRRPRK
jgi:hypothetical protein